MTKEKLLDICELHKVDPRGTELFNEEHILSLTGDIICGTNWGYGIYDCDLHRPLWFSHLSMKNWYNPSLFVPAYIEALCRKGIKEQICQIQFREMIVIKPFELRNDKEKQRKLIMIVTSHNEELREKMENELGFKECKGYDKF